MKLTQKLKIWSGKVGKCEEMRNAGYEHFLLSPLFLKPAFRVIIKSWDCVAKD